MLSGKAEHSSLTQHKKIDIYYVSGIIQPFLKNYFKHERLNACIYTYHSMIRILTIQNKILWRTFSIIRVIKHFFCVEL